MSNTFPCNSCGICCQSILRSKLTRGLDRGDGTCKHFDDDNKKCRIYNERPDICNIKTMYEKHYDNKFTWIEFSELNQQACKELFHEAQKINSKK